MLGSIVTSLLVLLLLSSLLYLQQPSMIFFPYRDFASTPTEWGLAYDDVSFKAGDGTGLHGWYIPRQKSDQVLLFFHGNAGNISHRGESVAIFHRLGLNVFIFDYRGYGHSQGKPSEEGLYADARAAWQYLTVTRGIDEADITLFGRSLGTAVASKLASEVQPRALILESAFSSARDVAKSVFPMLSYVTILRFKFDTADYVRSVTSPLLVVHSPDDEIIPFELGEKVYQAANQPKQFLAIEGDHNTGFLRSQPAYERALGEFISPD
ncbi:hypothetical protein MNBD_GAMMA20-1485 [hydrothermal vent metagenome]|uniref:Serine aminopeptidase S33 domain-containing protein n=1 Tax=hydrothermal vent metagenome TaxID=652676 RepID=A0A3B0ZXJ0_9ZZZZ